MDGSVILDLGVLVKEGVGGGHMATSMRQKVEEQISFRQSTNLVKNLLRCGLSCIAYTRALFPEPCFKRQRIQDVIVHTLQPDQPEPRRMIDWIDQGCLPSLEKRYLEEAVFTIYGMFQQEGSNPGFHLIETYNFQIRYHDNDVVMTRKSDGVEVSQSVPTKDDISQMMRSMIRSLIAMAGTLPPLPEERAFSMKLLYRDDVTPEDYEPEHFRRATSQQELRFFSRPHVTTLGAMATSFHELKLQLRNVDVNEEMAFVSIHSSGCQDQAATYAAYGACVEDINSVTLSDHIQASPSSLHWDNSANGCASSNDDESTISTGRRRAMRHRRSGRTGTSCPVIVEESAGDADVDIGRLNLANSSQSSERWRSSAPNETKGAKVKPSRVPQGVEESCLPVVGKTVASAGDDSGSASLPTEPLLPLETAKQILCSIRKRHLRRVPPQIASFPDIAQKTAVLIELHKSDERPSMDALLLELQILITLHSPISPHNLLEHFRGTHLDKSVIERHCKAANGIRIGGPRPDVNPHHTSDDETVDTATGGYGGGQPLSHQATTCTELPNVIQVHLSRNAISMSQSDAGLSQISDRSEIGSAMPNAAKRKISSSDRIIQRPCKRSCT
ncbi:unnamed protein product (mitochondrion) [Plasmodiophora brassicae]|uniref:HORMA domain-containing protein n=1 Tax=Plasmodiophora brassicae TaxID=37360 RepID=A0A0G4IYS9_PLABS|nr:hypothetical protein PBRA_001543 [Plasmodiophora brassicae]SPQ94010.1 unnamed protein product [Plasmodiophora brassicae]